MDCYFCRGELVEHLNSKDFRITKCTTCGIAQTEPRPILPAYEQLDFNNDSVGDNTGLKFLPDLPAEWQFLIQSQVDLVKKYIPTGSRVLEIGCGEGLLLEQIRQQGYTVEGIEPSLAGSGRAAQRGIEVYQGYFNPSVTNGKFDMVIMSHVLEHVEFPDKLIAEIVSVLKPGGFLMLTQTNYKGSIPTVLKEKWYAWVPEQHFWHFTVEGLTRWLKKFGLTNRDKKYLSLVHHSFLKYLPFNIFNAIKKSSMDQYLVLFQQSGNN